MMDVYTKMREIGLALPSMPVSGGNYALAVRSGRLVFTSGQTPKENGVLLQKGKLGREVNLEEGYALARRSTLNALAAAEGLIGSLERVERVVKVTVFVSSTPDFLLQSQVANGATDLLTALFGADRGLPARSAVGAAALPGDAPCEVELILECENEG